MILNFQKSILNTAKFHRQMHEAFPTYVKFTCDGSNLSLEFSGDISEADQAACSSFVTAFVDYTSVDQLEAYLEVSVFPFVKLLINTFAAENISMGITQAGKTADVLGLFTKQVDIGASNPVSLKATFDTGSLYVSISVLQYFRDNDTEYTGLSPYVTDARLLGMKNKIEAFLGLELST